MDVSGKKIAIIGMGRTALGLTRLLVREGASPFVSEAREQETVAPLCEELSRLGVDYECGGHTGQVLDGTALLVPSPGVPPAIPVVRDALAAGIDVVSEVELASRYCQSRVLAVTGTNGKTTTTELLRALLVMCGERVALAGNNALPLSDAVQFEPVPDYIVLEASSYQLELTRTFRPWIGAVLNLTPDHLARHGDLDGYAAAKGKLFAVQQAGDHAVVNADDERVKGMADASAAQRWPFSMTAPVERGVWWDGDACRCGGETLATAADISLPGTHNLQNVLAALTMMKAGGFDMADVREGLRTFQGVEHRIEPVATIDGVSYYNDSKATNIDSLKVALESFEVPVVLIAGGEGKGADYGVLRELVAASVKHLVTLGRDAPLLEEALAGVVPFSRARGMDEAVAMADDAAEPGDAVLLSPACASFDMFDNFEHRGRVFKECVQRRANPRQREAHSG